jgi:hypothetical protein
MSAPVVPPPELPEDGAELLNDVEAFLSRFVAFPSEAARIATTLWCAHAHGLGYVESTPRIGYLAPEKACGKTRALEVIATLVPNPMHAVNATPAALFRSVVNKPTILYDEIDTVFGPRAKENEEVRGLLNAGHRRSGVAYRCVGEGTKQKVQEFPAYCAVAFAGIGDLPDTIMSRTIVIPMRRRGPGETVEPYRARLHEKDGHALRDRLAEWMLASTSIDDAWPKMPEGVTDRDADVWEPLLAIADAAGGDWPERARVACVALVAAASESGVESLGVRLLRDLRTIFVPTNDKGEQAGEPHPALPTEVILGALHTLPEAPWSDLPGRLRSKPLDARGLATRLRQYGVTPGVIRVGEHTPRGYKVEDLLDPWSRYLPVLPCRNSATSATAQPAQANTEDDRCTVAPVAPLRQGRTGAEVVCAGAGCGQVFDNPNSRYCAGCMARVRAEVT